MAADPTQLGRIEFINEQEQLYFAEAVLGEDVLNFLNSETGKYLHGRAKLIYKECIEEMFKIDPYTPEGKKQHARIKQTAWCAESFMKWCAEVIIEGQQAAVQLENYREE